MEFHIIHTGIQPFFHPPIYGNPHMGIGQHFKPTKTTRLSLCLVSNSINTYVASILYKVVPHS